MAPKTAAQVAQKWQQDTSAAQQTYVDAVQATTIDPTARAIAQAQQAISGYTNAITSGRWAAALSAVGIQGWKAATLAKANNFSVGVAAGAPKYQAKMTTWLPIIYQAVANADSTNPRGTIQQNLARANAIAMALHNAKLQGA